MAGLVGSDLETASSWREEADLFCPECGYNLRGIESMQCPECGRPYERAQISGSQIPWTNFGRLGRRRAFLRTVWVATAHPKWIAQSCQARLDAGTGRAFVLWCAVPLGAVLAGVLLVAARNEPVLKMLTQGRMPSISLWAMDLLYPLHCALSVWPVCVIVAAGLAVGLAMLPARVALVSGYPEEVRDRIVAGAHYLAGAWIGGGVAGLVVGLAFAMALLGSIYRSTQSMSDVLDAVALICGVVVPITAVAVWMNAWHVYRRGVAGLAGRRTFQTVLVALPLLALHLGVWLILIPWCVGFLILAARTLLG